MSGGVDPRIADRQFKRVMQICKAFGLTDGERHDIATVLLDRNIETFKRGHLHEVDIDRLWWAMNGALYVAKTLMDRKDQHAKRG